jgi:hypothetical protein
MQERLAQRMEAVLSGKATPLRGTTGGSEPPESAQLRAQKAHFVLNEVAGEEGFEPSVS